MHQRYSVTKKILILHDLSVGSRGTNRDHLYNFSKYEKGNFYLYHCAHAPVTDELKAIGFDGVIINYCFLGYRAGLLYAALKQKYAWLRDLSCPKIAICQDDYTDSGILDEWLDYMKVTTIYSPIQDGVDKLYPLNWGKKRFKLGLTAYTDNAQLTELAKCRTPFKKRKVDVGTRVRYLPPQFGRYGRIKGESAEDFRDAADVAGFETDISTDPRDVIFGSDWLKFMGNCKFTLGSKGGSSLNDPQGKLRHKIANYLIKNPDAGFAEVEKKCFPGLDGIHIFAGVSPRLFEAAALKTCQILIRDEYIGGIEEYIDYIPLDEDLSNIEEVFELMRDDEKCMAMVESCYNKLIATNKFDYSNFVPDVLSEIKASKHGITQTDINHINKHFAALAPYQNVRSKIGGFYERLWRRVIANAVYVDSPEYICSTFQLPAELSSCFSAVLYLQESDCRSTNIEFSADMLAMCRYIQADTDDLKQISELAVKNDYTYEDLETWWDMCEYIYEPAKINKPRLRSKSPIKKPPLAPKKTKTRKPKKVV